MGFIRKVYAILTLQLAVTAGIVCLFMYVDSVKEFVQDPDHAWVYWTSYGLTLACVIALVCVGELRRKAPYNFLFLGVFTLCEGYLLGAIATVYDTDIVLMAMGLTVAVSVATTLFACQTRYDFTTLGSTLFAALFVLLFFGLSMIWFYDRVTHMLYAAAGALIFTLYIAYDTQLIIGGKKYAISPEEYIFAALSLYLDVVNLFLFILQLVGGGGRR